MLNILCIFVHTMLKISCVYGIPNGTSLPKNKREINPGGIVLNWTLRWLVVSQPIFNNTVPCSIVKKYLDNTEINVIFFKKLIFYQHRTPTLNILKSKIRHENDDIFKNVLTKKGVEYFYLSNNTNKSIAVFRETIPLSMQVIQSLVQGSGLSWAPAAEGYSWWRIGWQCCLGNSFLVRAIVKGTVSRDFWPSVFFANRLHLGPWLIP
jgi:hypothetical protein